MKNSVYLVLMILTSFSGNTQNDNPNRTSTYDISFDLAGYIAGKYNIGIDKVWSEDFSTELNLAYRDVDVRLDSELGYSSIEALINAKYFIDQGKDLDGIYMSAFLKVASRDIEYTNSVFNEITLNNDVITYDFEASQIGLGFMLGHKSVKKNDRIFLDFNAGLGRNVFYNYDDNGGDASDILRSQVAGNLRLIFIGKLSFGFRIG